MIDESGELNPENKENNNLNSNNIEMNS